MPIDVTIADITVISVSGAWLSEAVGALPRLILAARLDLEGKRLRDLLDREVRLAAECEFGRTVQFEGKVAAVEQRGQRDAVLLHVRAASSRFEATRRTRSFCASGFEAQSITSLPGFADAFRGIEGLSLVDAKVECLTQFHETDWQFLVRAAALSGSVVLPGETPKVVRECRTEVLEVEARDILEDTVRTRLASDVVAHECLTWDRNSGIIPGAPAASEGQAGAERHQSFDSFPAPGDDRGRAEILAKMNTGPLSTWSAMLRDPRPAPGMRIDVPAEFGVDESLLVRQRELVFDVQGGADQLLNRVHCEVGKQLHPAADAVFGPSTLHLVVGQVCGIAPADRRPRVKVNFPWQERSGAPESWPGIWCEVTQPSAGQGDLPHGMLNLPCRLDWVAVLLDVPACTPPVVLGAFFHEANTIPRQLFDHTEDTLVLLTEAGHVIAARHGDRSLIVGMVANGDLANPLAALELRADPPSVILKTPNGDLRLHGTRVVTEASDSATVDTPQFDVRGRQA